LSGHTALGIEALDQAVRLHVYRHAAETARVPKPDEIAAAVGQPLPEVEKSIQRLAADHVWVLAPGTANIWAANPFCAVPFNFRVSARGRTYWGICIWDALGIAATLNSDATVVARCGDCDEEIVLEVRDGALARGEGVVHFAVPASQWWDNIAFT